jgi:hypothetical protein
MVNKNYKGIKEGSHIFTRKKRNPRKRQAKGNKIPLKRHLEERNPPRG